MGTTKTTLMEELMKQTQSFKEFCKKIDNLDHFETLLNSILTNESQVIEFLNQEANQELQETFQIWQKENSEFLNFCKIIMEERRKMIGENIFGPQQSDDQSTILLIHVTTAYESLKEKLNKNQELEKQIFQLHSLQNKINQRFKEIFKNANIELLTDELPRMKAPEETPEAYQKYVEAFYNPLEENTEIESEPAKKEETGSFIFPEDILIMPETTLTNSDLPAEQIIFEEPKKPVSNTQSNAFEKDVKPLEPIENNVVAETIKNRRKNYDTYLKKLYEIMDDFELARREIQDASNGKLKITDFLQNRYNKGVDVQGVVVKEIKRIKEIEKFVEDPSVDLKIPNSDMSKEAMVEHFENGWIPGDNYIPIQNQSIALPLPKTKENVYPNRMEENHQNVLESYIEPENPAKYPFDAELLLHQNAKLWGKNGPLEGETPIPAKYPLDAIRFTKGYLVIMPNGIPQMVYDENSLTTALTNQGKVAAVEAFDGLYSIHDVTLKEKVATIKH